MECESCSVLTEIEANIKAQLEKLHEPYRHTLIKRNYTHSPLIHQFPLEIVTSIFILAFPYPEECPWCLLVEEQFRVSPLVLTKVCHTWRELALSTPRLWSFISLDVFNPKFPLLNHQITHSGVVPLTVYLFAHENLSDQGFSDTKQALSLFIKQFHRIAAFYVILSKDFARLCCSISDLDYPKTTPLLKEFHFHGAAYSWDSSFQLRLAIPPSPRQVCLSFTSPDKIWLDWNSVSSLTLESCHIQMLPLGLESLKHLVLIRGNWDLPLETPVVCQSIQDVTHKDSDPANFLFTMTLPSLRSLDVRITDMRTLNPIACDFLHRSLCPLQVLTIHYTGVDDGEQVIQALIGVLEITKVLQHLTVRFLGELFDDLPSSGPFEPLIRRFTSQPRGFLPSLQSFSLKTRFIPPIDLLLDAMAPSPSYEIPNGPNKERTLRTLNLELDTSYQEVGPIRQDVLVRILQMRATGKKISIHSDLWLPSPRDLVEHWKSSYYGADIWM